MSKLEVTDAMLVAAGYVLTDTKGLHTAYRGEQLLACSMFKDNVTRIAREDYRRRVIMAVAL